MRCHRGVGHNARVGSRTARAVSSTARLLRRCAGQADADGRALTLWSTGKRRRRPQCWTRGRAVAVVVASVGVERSVRKPLGRGLYEFRIRRSLDTILRSAGLPDAGGGREVLVRVFCAFVGDKVVLLLGGYDKRPDPSARRQQREIARARAELARWRRESRA